MDLTELAKSYYRAFENYDRAFIEDNLAPGFTFTSPFDLLPESALELR